MSLHITQSITTQQENRRRINTLGFHASVLSPRLSSLLHSLSLQAPLDKSTLCANKINLYIALIFFFFKLITTKMSKKKKKNGEKREKSLNLEIVFNFSVHFLHTRLEPTASRSSERCRGSGANIFVCVHFNDINSI